MVQIEEYHSCSEDEDEKEQEVKQKQQKEVLVDQSPKEKNSQASSTATTRTAVDDTTTSNETQQPSSPKQSLSQPQSQQSQDSVTRHCDGCGLPPRISVQNDTLIPLKRCSLCHQAWYHDQACQKRHFPKHKTVCKKLQRQRQQQKEVSRQTATCLVQEQNSHRGRCLMANQTLTYGAVLGPSTNEKEKAGSKHHWKPTVPPVLLENHRRFRCVVCFGLLHQQQQQNNNNNNNNNNQRISLLYSELESLYPTRTCSDACQRASASFVTAECEAIAKLQKQQQQQQPNAMCPPMILPTAILLYRLIRAIEQDKTGHVRSVLLSQLQSERDIPSKDEDDSDGKEKAHAQAVTATAWAMMRVSNVPLWKLEDVETLLQQIKLNGFSICTAESVALGIGLYTSIENNNHDMVGPTSSNDPHPAAPNYINHDCQPNLIQTFDYGVAGTFPSLRLTVCVPTMESGQELTISYTDASMPRHLRRQQLQANYGFFCLCAACCGSDQDDAAMAGLKCPQKPCQGLVLPKNNQCSVCQTTVAANVWEEELLEFQSLEDDNLSALERACRNLELKCTDASWYVQECQEKFLQALLDTLGSTDDLQQQYSIAQRALQLTERLLASSPKKEWFVLRRTILQYKAIKLRLFLNIHPDAAMRELQERILPTCSTFFPSHHEIMRQIVQDACQ